MYFCKGIEAGMRVIAVLRLYLLSSLLVVCEAGDGYRECVCLHKAQHLKEPVLGILQKQW